MEEEPFKARALAALVVGFGGMWLAMKLYVRIRYGRDARISMDMR